MKSLSNLKFGANEVLERNQMKSIAGGCNSVPISINCGDGDVMNFTGCAEHAQAWIDLANDYCG